MKKRGRWSAMAVIGVMLSLSLGGRGEGGEELQGLARIVYADSVLGTQAALAIVPHVSGVADRDPATHAWRYRYTLRNDPASTNVIRYFGVSPVPKGPLI